jgi:hypothetical protein
MPPKSKLPTPQNPLAQPSVDESRTWRIFVEYTWPRPDLPKYQKVFEVKFAIYVEALISTWLSRVFGRVIFSHASLLAVSRHPCDGESVGALWELGTADGHDYKGAEIQTLASYFSHKQITENNIPAGWKPMFGENEPEYYHEFREYREVGQVRAAMREINERG